MTAALTEIHPKGSVPTFAAVSLGDYALGLRPRPTRCPWGLENSRAPASDTPSLPHGNSRPGLLCVSPHLLPENRLASVRTSVFVCLVCYEAALQKKLARSRAATLGQKGASGVPNGPFLPKKNTLTGQRLGGRPLVSQPSRGWANFH